MGAARGRGARRRAAEAKGEWQGRAVESGGESELAGARSLDNGRLTSKTTTSYLCLS